MIISFHLAANVASLISPLTAPKFRPSLLASALDMPASRHVLPDGQCPAVLRRSSVQVDMFRWGWTKSRTMKSIYFCQANVNYGRRCLIPASAIDVVAPHNEDDTLYRITGNCGGPLFMGAVWRATSPGAPQSIALMLDMAGPDMPVGSKYQPVLIAPTHAEMFLDHNIRNVRQLQSFNPGALAFEPVGSVAGMAAANTDPFGAETDPHFAVHPATVLRIVPEAH